MWTPEVPPELHNTTQLTPNTPWSVCNSPRCETIDIRLLIGIGNVITAVFQMGMWFP